jgi:hypothetical protein
VAHQRYLFPSFNEPQNCPFEHGIENPVNVAFFAGLSFYVLLLHC